MLTPTNTNDMVRDLERIIGSENVAFDEISRALYSTDASNYQISPLGVTFPRHADDVVAIQAYAAKHSLPILSRGGGTSLAGQTVGEAIIMDFTRHMRRIVSINAETKTVRVQPGMVLEQLNQQLAPLGLMFGPDPASANRATIGGCIGNNATGAHSILYGMTADHVLSLDVVLADGQQTTLGSTKRVPLNSITQPLHDKVRGLLTHYADAIANHAPKTWRNAAGYGIYRMNPDDVDLAQLIVGAEGTLATITSAELNLVPRPKMTRLAVVHFQDLIASLEAVPAILETSPSAIELFDKLILDRTRTQPEFAKRLTFVEGDPDALLAVEYYGNTEAELDASIQRLNARLTAWGHNDAIIIAHTPDEQANVWKVRKAGLGLLSSNRSDWKTVACIEDATVPVEHLAEYISYIRDIVTGEGAEMAVYAHASAGCLHVRPLLNLKTEDGLRQYHAIAEASVEAVLRFGGTTSGEHAEGLLRAEFSERLYGPEMTQAFREIKQLFDSDNRMNPGKKVDAPRMDDQSLMRFGTNYGTPLTLVDTYFDWSADQGFDGAVEMCNGAGVCRKEDNGTMCPSFMATREEVDSTRGRANILRLAMTGAFGLDGMQDERVKSVLDLCLSCKACKAECPSSVDMARIKSEFMANYQDTHGVSLRSRLFGTVHLWSRFAAIAPHLANIGANFPAISGTIKRWIGIAPDRQLPAFAGYTFSSWWNKQIAHPQHRRTTRPTPLLLIDTFTQYYQPHLGQAVYHIAKRAGLPLQAIHFPQHGCCGRPAMSKGLLADAKALATSNVQHFARILADDPDTRFMILEPSCMSAIIDDYPTLVDLEWQAWASHIAANTISVEDWLAELQQDGIYAYIEWDAVPREVILHGHCHQKALWGAESTKQALSAIPTVSLSEIDAGCCGMAGSFGYEADHYNVSITIAEQRLYPAVRANPDKLLAAPGTSCREQVAHIEGEAYHPVEIVAMACGWQRP